jgi:hypothetical protein
LPGSSDVEALKVGGHVLIDANGPELLSQQEISEIERKVTDSGGTPIKLFVFMQTDVVVTSEGCKSYSSFSKTFSQQSEPFEKEAVKKIIEFSNYKYLVNYGHAQNPFMID